MAEGIVIGGGGGVLDAATAEPKYVLSGVPFIGMAEELEIGEMAKIADTVITLQPDAEVTIAEGLHAGGSIVSVDISAQTTSSDATLESVKIYTTDDMGAASLTSGSIIQCDADDILNYKTWIDLSTGYYPHQTVTLGDVYVLQESYTPTTDEIVLNTAGKYLSGDLAVAPIPEGGIANPSDWGYHITSSGVYVEAWEAPFYLAENTPICIGVAEPVDTSVSSIELYPGMSSYTADRYLPANIIIKAATCEACVNSSWNVNAAAMDCPAIEFIPDILSIRANRQNAELAELCITDIMYYKYNSKYFLRYTYLGEDREPITGVTSVSSAMGVCALSDGSLVYTAPSTLVNKGCYFTSNGRYDVIGIKM